MPDMKVMIPAIIGIAVLVLIVGTVGWLLDHLSFVVPVLILLAGSIYLLRRHAAARNRV